MTNYEKLIKELIDLGEGELTKHLDPDNVVLILTTAERIANDNETGVFYPDSEYQGEN